MGHRLSSFKVRIPSWHSWWISKDRVRIVKNELGRSATQQELRVWFDWLNWYFIAIPPLKDVFSNDFFRHSLDDSPASYLIQLPSPSLNTVKLIVIHNHTCEHSSKLQLSIRYTPSRCLDVWQDWYPMYYPEGMKARVSHVQSIEPHRILARWHPLGTRTRNLRVHSPE